MKHKTGKIHHDDMESYEGQEEGSDPHADPHHKKMNKEHGAGGFGACYDEYCDDPSGGGATPASNAKHHKG